VSCAQSFPAPSSRASRTNVRWRPVARRTSLAAEDSRTGGGPTVKQKIQRLGSGLVWIAVAAPLAAGCSSNGPLASTKLAQAERAVDEAQQGGAAVSVPVELRTPEDKLKAARAAMANKDQHQP